MTRTRRPSTPILEQQPASRAALLLIDWFSPWEFAERDQVLRHARPAAMVAQRLLTRARQAQVPVIYANDNFGAWRSDFRAVVDRAHQAGPVPAQIADLLAPVASDHFVLKPKHSAFHATPLALLLAYLRTRVLVVAGVAGNQCVLATAIDARMHDFDVIAVDDASASVSAAAHRTAFAQLAAFGVTIRRSSAIRWNRWHE